ncbi:hypothetical protein TZ01_01380 [Acidiplasma sp. MBA-1]|jgi:hypothetical protein|uniref:Uncharacterized protein n=2 Tax=Acidiplasma TaxID=507753 RepID=A0A0Q0VYC1_9ARCH|nr:hypothetical protein TZ01_01380 [Acidiplasma sp. MBA-1]KQB35808.1 hypothetical protein AOG54_08495 [Acidiplasma aeolicum]KQB36787.1 hypothetical protein AOG55_03155 [Acidiplasma cupricumulans]
MNKNKIYKYSLFVVIIFMFIEAVLGITISIYGIMKNQMVFKYLLVLFTFILIFVIFATLHFYKKLNK